MRSPKLASILLGAAVGTLVVCTLIAPTSLRSLRSETRSPHRLDLLDPGELRLTDGHGQLVFRGQFGVDRSAQGRTLDLLRPRLAQAAATFDNQNVPDRLEIAADPAVSWNYVAWSIETAVLESFRRFRLSMRPVAAPYVDFDVPEDPTLDDLAIGGRSFSAIRIQLSIRRMDDVVSIIAAVTAVEESFQSQQHRPAEDPSPTDEIQPRHEFLRARIAELGGRLRDSIGLIEILPSDAAAIPFEVVFTCATALRDAGIETILFWGLHYPRPTAK